MNHVFSVARRVITRVFAIAGAHRFLLKWRASEESRFGEQALDGCDNCRRIVLSAF
jgi:hypothetical protein